MARKGRVRVRAGGEAYCLTCSWRLLGSVEDARAKGEQHSIETGHEVLGFDNEKEWSFGGERESLDPTSRHAA
jgi:hypothetical protein